MQEPLLRELADSRYAELEEQKQKLEKSHQMLRNLIEPLERLTEALNKTQTETQEIRAILYEPMETIFALVPRIAQYFEQDRMIANPDGSQTCIAHQPVRYGSEGKVGDARWVLAHILAAIRGKKPDLHSSEEALAYEIFFFVTAEKDDKSPFQQLAATTLRFIDYASSSPVDAVEALGVLKRRLFTPFKPDAAQNIIEWDVIEALLPHGAIVSPPERSKKCIPADINPFATQGHLLRFISGVISATFNATKGGCKKFGVDVADNGISFSPNNDQQSIITAGYAPRLYDVLLREIRAFIGGSRPLEENWGDRADPFVRLIRRLPPEYRDGGSLDGDGQKGFRVNKGNSCVVECLANNDGLSITIEQLMIEYRKQVFVISRTACAEETRT